MTPLLITVAQDQEIKQQKRQTQIMILLLPTTQAYRTKQQITIMQGTNRLIITTQAQGTNLLIITTQVQGTNLLIVTTQV